MATCCQDFDQSGAKYFDHDLIGSSADGGKIEEANVDGFKSAEQRDARGSEDAFVLNVDAKITQIGRENDMSFGSMEIATSLGNAKDRHNDRPVLKEDWKPGGILSVGRTRSGFPDCKHDHRVQLLVCKNQHKRETVDLTDKYDIAVTVTHDRDGVSDPRLRMPDFQYTRIKSETDNRSMAGIVGFLFRFHEPNTKYRISFALQTAPTTKKGKKKTVKHHSACETVSEISITLETGSWAIRKAGKPRKRMVARRVPPSSALAPASLSEESMELCKRSSWVMKELQSRRDNAEWDDFDKFSGELLVKFLDTDTQITIKLEQSVAACYRNDMENSLELIDESFALIPQATNVQLLAGRGYGYRAGVMRRKGRLGEAHDCVQLAEQNNRACHTNLDTSFIVYERASVLLDFIGRTAQRSPKQINEALRNLEKCIDVCLEAEMQDSELYVKKHHFAFIKIAMLLLDCRTEAARERVLSEDFIAKSQECLHTLKSKYWLAIPEGLKIQFNLASSDLEYRRGNYTEAERFASLAKDSAVELGFNTEISLAQERLDHMRVIARDYSGSIRNGLGLFSAPLYSCASASEGEDGDVSSTSGSESDCLRILE